MENILYQWLKTELIKDISWETYFNKGYISILPLIDDKINKKDNYTLKIEIKKISKINWEINENSKIISIIQINKNLIEIPLEAVFKNKKISDFEKITIYLNNNSIEIDFGNKRVFQSEITINLESIEKIYLLKDFYGKINLINDDFIFLKKKGNFFKKEININFKLEYSDNCRNNYINYFNNEFSIFEYFDELKPLITFVSLINGIYENKNITSIGSIDINVLLQGFIQDISYVLNQFCGEKLCFYKKK